ncbi:MAG: methionine biosynthesis protein MetW, partial [Acidimicrobiales bacterium]
MDERPPAWKRVDELVEQLRDRVEQRRRQGAYPPGLEADLDDHFRRIVAHRVQPGLDELKQRLGRLDLHMGFDPARIASSSQVVGGTAVHRGVSKLVARQTSGVLQQVMEFADAVRDVLRSAVAALEDPDSHVHAELVGQIDHVLERMAHYERDQLDAVAAEANIADLGRRLEAAEVEFSTRLSLLEVAEERRTFRPWFSNERFEEEFRGTHDELLERYRGLVTHFAGLGPVLEIGCGRGEFLELLGELGVPASGVELDPDLAKLAGDRGLAVVAGNGLEVLAQAEPASLGGLVLVQ